MRDKPTHYRETVYGFEYGAARISRHSSFKGHVMLMIETDRQCINIRVTPSGLIRIEQTKGKLKID